jgi:hypothetical protein
MKFYRYQAEQTGGYNEDTDTFWSGSPRLRLIEFEMKKETPKGYWIGYEWCGDFDRWVSKTSVKRYAYPTKKEALINYIKRTTRRIEIMEAQAASAKAALYVAQRMNLETGEQIII